MPSSPPRHPLLRLAETLLVAALGAAALGLPGFPAGWLSGAIIAVTVVALAGRPVLVPDSFGRAVFVLLGISLGAAVTPDTLARMATWPASLSVLALAMAAITLSISLYLHYVHGWDALSALFAAA